MAHIVKAPLVITKKQDGSDLYLYENAEVPEFVGGDEVKRLAALGLVVDASSDEKRAAKQPTSESN